MNGIKIHHMFYRIRRNIDSDFNLAIWQSHKDHQINLRHYQSIYTTSMGFSTYSTHLKSHKQCLLSKTPNVMFTNNSVYTVLGNDCCIRLYQSFAINLEILL